MPKLYIDFDGVILDTWKLIFDEYCRIYAREDLVENDIKQTMLDIGWDNILANSKEINNSLNTLKKLNNNFDLCILTKINSDQEINSKTKFLKNLNINNMIFVPYNESKTKYVDVKDNILIDDDMTNIEEWEKAGGMGILFNNSNIIDNNSKNYICINNLLDIYDIISHK